MGKNVPGEWKYPEVVCAWQAYSQTGGWVLDPQSSACSGTVGDGDDDEFGEVTGADHIWPFRPC